MKALEELAPKQQNKNTTLSPKVKELLAKGSRGVLLGVFRLAQDRSRRKGAYFWRQVKQESWRLLAGAPAFQPSWVGKPHYPRSRWSLRGRR